MIPVVNPVELAVAAVAITSETIFALRVVNTSVAIPLRVAGMVQTSDGSVQVFNQVYNVALSSVAQEFVLGMPAGRLLQCAVTPQQDFPMPGIIYAQLTLSYRQGAGSVVIGVIAEGWVSKMGAVCYPGDSNGESRQTQNPSVGMSFNSPAVGVEFSNLFSGIRLSPCWSVRCQLVCDANVATRFPYVFFARPGAPQMRYYSQLQATAGQTRVFQWSDTGTVAWLHNVFVSTPMPAYYTGIISLWGVGVDNIQVGDQLSEISMVYTPEIDTGF